MADYALCRWCSRPCHECDDICRGCLQRLQTEYHDAVAEDLQ
jgi:hypothetical protein